MKKTAENKHQHQRQHTQHFRSYFMIILIQLANPLKQKMKKNRKTISNDLGENNSQHSGLSSPPSLLCVVFAIWYFE